MRCRDRWRWPARHPPACRAPRLRPRRSGVQTHPSLLARCRLLSNFRLRFIGQRVRHQYQAMRATSRGRLIVVARYKCRDRVDELITEGGAVSRRSKPDLSVQRQRRQVLIGCPGPAQKITDLIDDASAQGDEKARGKPVRTPSWIEGNGAKRLGGDDIGHRACHEQAFLQSSPQTDLSLPHQLVRLEGPHVVIELLARYAEAGREGCGGGRLSQLRQEATPDRFQRHHRGSGIGDDVHIVHELSRPLTRKIVNGPPGRSYVSALTLMLVPILAASLAPPR